MDSDSLKRDLVMTGYDNIYYEYVWRVTYDSDLFKRDLVKTGYDNIYYE